MITRPTRITSRTSITTTPPPASSHPTNTDPQALTATTTLRAAVIHVAADAAVSILVIIGLLLARAFGWLWMDPLAGIVGACVIASWSYGLIRDTGAILLDMNPDRAWADELRQGDRSRRRSPGRSASMAGWPRTSGRK